MLFLFPDENLDILENYKIEIGKDDKELYEAFDNGITKTRLRAKTLKELKLKENEFVEVIKEKRAQIVAKKDPYEGISQVNSFDDDFKSSQEAEEIIKESIKEKIEEALESKEVLELKEFLKVLGLLKQEKLEDSTMGNVEDSLMYESQKNGSSYDEDQDDYYDDEVLDESSEEFSIEFATGKTVSKEKLSLIEEENLKEELNAWLDKRFGRKF